MDRLIAANAVPKPLVGVLWAEDFDAPEPEAPVLAIVQEEVEPEPFDAPEVFVDQVPPEPIEPEVITPSFSAEELEEARREGYARGRDDALRAARDERDATVRLLLSRIAEQLEQWREEAVGVAEATAEAVALLVIQTLASLLPALCASHASNEVIAVARCVLPLLTLEPRIEVRVHPSVQADLQALLAGLDAAFTRRVDVVAIDTLAVGDLRIGWQDGEAVRDSRAMLAAVTEMLAALGIETKSAPTLSAQVPAAAPAKPTLKSRHREMAHG